MKKLILLTGTILIATLGFAQTNFKWDKVDSVAKTKGQIYSDTKMFIAEYWKSAQNVIQNDDKEGGAILIKGASIQKVNHSLNVFTYVYHYSVTIKMKDNKYRIVLDNVYCESAIPVGAAQYEILKIEPFDSVYVKGKTGMTMATLPEAKAVAMMSNLKTELQAIIDNYDKYIKKPSTTSGDW
jgi:hypothetical protein